MKCFEEVGITDFDKISDIMKTGKYPSICTDSCVHIAFGFFDSKGAPIVNNTCLKVLKTQYKFKL